MAQQTFREKGKTVRTRNKTCVFSKYPITWGILLGTFVRNVKCNVLIIPNNT